MPSDDHMVYSSGPRHPSKMTGIPSKVHPIEIMEAKKKRINMRSSLAVGHSHGIKLSLYSTLSVRAGY